MLNIIWPWTPIEKPLALPMEDWGAKPGDYTWENWHKDAKKQYPVRYWFQETLRGKYAFYKRLFVTEPLYFLRTHTYNRYHLLNLKCPTWGLEYKWGWFDRSELILIAPFNILKQFVEKELPHSLRDWEFDESSKATLQEIKDLYEWWMRGRIANWKEWSHNLDKIKKEKGSSSEEYTKELRRMDALEAQDDEMLMRLIKVRGYLWS